MEGNLLVTKSRAFALRIVQLYKYLQGKKELVLSKQMLRSGTSIGANIAEGQYAQSKADFLTKYSIALKEASETRYWLDLLCNSGYLGKGTSNREQGVSVDDSISSATASIIADCDELLRLLTSSVKKLKEQK